MTSLLLLLTNIQQGNIGHRDLFGRDKNIFEDAQIPMGMRNIKYETIELMDGFYVFKTICFIV